MGKLRKIKRTVEKNPKLWIYKQRFPDIMFKAKHVKFVNGRVVPASSIDPERGYRMYVRKCIMHETGYTENMIE